MTLIEKADTLQQGPIIEVENVVVRYGKLVALDVVSVSFERGATGLVGRNGAGKSTLLRLLLGLVRADSGSGRVLDIPLSAAGHRLRHAVGYMPERDSLVPGLRGVEQVALAGELCGLSKRAAIRRAHDLLGEVDLGEARYRPVEQYSTGMKQRLKLAVALTHDPELLLLDEPTVGLDPPSRRRMLELIKDLVKRFGKSLLISTHLLDDIQQTCQSVVMIDQGKIIASGSIEEVVGNGRSVYRIEWEGDSPEFARWLESESLHYESGKSALWNAAVVHLASDFDPRRLFQTAQQHQVRIRAMEKRGEDLSELYHRLVVPGREPARSIP